jgi:hypothetical protein
MFPFGGHGSFQQIFIERDVTLSTIRLLIAAGTEIQNYKRGICIQ